MRKAFLEMADDPEGSKMLAASAAVIKQTPPMSFIAAKDGEFDNMRRFYRTTRVKIELH